MFTEARSPSGTLTSSLGTVRVALTSTAALRAAIILSFILYEVPFLRRLSTGEDWLRLPLWDFALVDDSRTFIVLEGIYLCASVLACFPRFVIPGCFVAGTASILLVVFDLTYRLQFAFLPGGALLAFGLSEMSARSGDPKKRVDLPLVLFLASVYGFASFHKLVNFPWMKTSLPADVFNAAGGTAPALCDNSQGMLLGLIAWTVVPYEALLAVLVSARRWLKLRLACVSLFHWMLVALVPFIWHVSFYMLCLSLYLAALQRPAVQQRMFANRNWFVLVAAESVFVGAKIIASSMSGPAALVLGNVMFANAVLFPIFFFYWPFWTADRAAVDAPLHMREVGGVGVAAYGALLVTFGFSPLLLEKHYSVRSLGWSMFAGGEYRDGSYYTLRAPASPCFTYPMIHGMIWSQADDRQIHYLAFRRADLERLKRFFEQRKCSGPPLQVVREQF